MGISKKRQYLNIGIVIVIAIGIYIFKFPFKPVDRNIEERGVTDEIGLRQGTWEGFEDGQLFYRRTYVNDTVHGLSQQYHKNGTLESEVNYLMGHFVDTMFVYHSNGKPQHITYYDSTGTQQGESKIFHDNGQLSQISQFVNGRMNGESTCYYKKGQLKSVWNFDNGMRTGTWIELSEQGDTTLVEHYENGELSEKSADNKH